MRARVFTICCGLTIATLALAATIRGADNNVEQDEAQLIEVLKSDAPKRDKAITCKRLAVYGTADAVPMLAELLSDEELASWALIALEAIPASASDDALRSALADLDGRLLVGVINSIGVRRDAAAVDQLVTHLNSADPHVVAAAAYALGRIGNASAATALADALNDSPDASRSSVAEGCILCAERLFADGQTGQSVDLYDKVRVADVSKQRILEATRGAILARQADGLALLVEQLQSEDKDQFHTALRTSREISGAEVTKAIVTQLSQAAPERQVLLITALAARDDIVLPAILQAAQTGSNEVRTVAVGVLRRVGDVSCVPVLLELATGDASELAATAQETLEAMPGESVDKEIAGRLPEADGDMRRLLIELVGSRRIEAVPALLKAADDADPTVRAAALTSLGETVGQGDLAVLITRVAKPGHPDDTEVAQKALRTACVRMPDRDACAEQLFVAMAKAPLSSKVALLETIGDVGGSKALESVATAAKDKNPELQNTASQLLGKWMSTDAAPVLLELANSESDYKIRALRGYIRMARQFSFPIDQRVEMCRQALAAAGRDAERILILDVLERYPSVGTLKLAVDAAKTESIKDRASRSTLVIARKLGGESIDVQSLLAQIGQGPRKIEILEARYGAGDKMQDVTSVIRKHVGAIPVIILPSPSYNASFGGDPVPGTQKQLTIRYTIDGQPGEATFDENEAILLSVGK